MRRGKEAVFRMRTYNHVIVTRVCYNVCLYRSKCKRDKLGRARWRNVCGAVFTIFCVQQSRQEAEGSIVRLAGGSGRREDWKSESEESRFDVWSSH
jgi:hypothetical protein